MTPVLVTGRAVSVVAGQLFVSVILIITLLLPIVIIPTTVINVFLGLSFQSMLNCAHYSNEANCVSAIFVQCYFEFG